MNNLKLGGLDHPVDPRHGTAAAHCLLRGRRVKYGGQILSLTLTLQHELGERRHCETRMLMFKETYVAAKQLRRWQEKKSRSDFKVEPR